MRTALKFGFFIVIVFLISTSLYGQHTLKEIYYRDYEMINRTVIVLTGRANYIIDQQANNRRIVLTLERTRKGPGISALENISSSLLESVKVNDSSGGRLVVTITTRVPFYLEHFDLSGTDHRIVFDVFSKRNPNTDLERLAFSKFFFTVGQKSF